MPNNRTLSVVSALREMMADWGPLLREIQTNPNLAYEDRPMFLNAARELMRQGFQDLIAQH